MDRGLQDTAAWWPDVQIGYAFVNQAAEILRNPRRCRSATVRCAYESLLRRMRRRAKGRGPLATSLRHFLKVTESYWPGLFHCYDVPDLPRTNNGLEQLFGSTRHHERRCDRYQVRKQGHECHNEETAGKQHRLRSSRHPTSRPWQAAEHVGAQQ